MKNRGYVLILFLLTLWAKWAHTQVPALSSYPQAHAVIFLDFDGQTVEGTAWNYAGPIVCGPAALDSVGITTVFDRVAEDYRPFDVNITTDSTKFLAAPIDRRMRVILTVTSSWYGSAGGVAFAGSFTWGDDTPCFVFTQLLGNNLKKIAEAAAHEAGHTLGLYHQSAYDVNCVKTSDYNSGTGSGEIGWAPIMGVGYSRNFTLWHNGPNSFGCSSIQNDLDIITSGANGFGYRSDDHGATAATATPLSFSNDQFLINGIIERTTDQDEFSFVLNEAGRFQLNAVPYNVGSNNSGSDLDMQVSLLNSSESVIGSYNPGTLLNSVIDTALLPGTYYIKVDGIGNMYASEYGSLGSYSLQGLFTAAAPLPLRRLELQGRLEKQGHQLAWLIDADEQVTAQELEYSRDGRTFRLLATPAPGERSLLVYPEELAAAQYRLHVFFDNAPARYSNIVTLPGISLPARPSLVSNRVTGNELLVKSPGVFGFEILNLNGVLVTQGRLSAGVNRITVPVTGGLYLIRYSGNGQAWSEKFFTN